MSTEVETADNLELTLDRVMHELDSATNKLPEDAIREAEKHRDQITPRLIEAIRNATARAASGDVPEGNAHFFALFLLTEFQAKESLPAILEAVSLPGELPFDLFGDAITTNLCSVLAALAGDTPEVLDALIENRSLNEYVRWGAADAFLCLVRDRRLTRDDAVERLRSHLRAAITNQDADGAGLLILTLDSFSPREAESEIQEAFRLDLVDPSLVGLAEVERSIAEGDSRFQSELERCRPTGIQDTIEELKLWHAFSENKPEFKPTAVDDSWDYDQGLPARPRAPEPIHNIEPRIGRNDPCPCGSGKKYKKCCWAR